jgi:hypothetical protein
MMALSSFADARNIVIGGFDLEGPFDAAAFQRALCAAVHAFPEVASGVDERSGDRGLVWTPPAPDYEPELLWERPRCHTHDESFHDWFLRRIMAETPQAWDIFHVRPSKFLIFEESLARRRFMSVNHHAALDGWALCGFLKTILDNYHRLVSGEHDCRAVGAPFASTGKQSPASITGSRVQDALLALRQGASALGRAAIPRGGGIPGASGEHWVKLVLSEEETELASRAVFHKSFSHLDIISAALIRAVDEWNDARGFPRHTARVGAPVQMRGRHGQTEASVNISFFLSTVKPQDRRDMSALVACLARSRITQMRRAADVRSARAGDALLRFFRLFPLPLRRRMVHRFWRTPFAPLLVSSFGVLWPLPESTGFVKDSACARVGGLEVSEAHILGYKHAPNNPVRVLAYTFRRRLNATLWTSNRILTPEQAKAFSQLFRQGLVKIAATLADCGDAR